MVEEKKLGDGSTSNAVVIQLVIRELNGGSSYPVHTKTNYSDWALLMKVKLKMTSLWHVVEKGGADEHDEMMAIEAPCSVVPPEMVPSIISKDTAKKAWKTISDMRVGSDHVKKAAAVQLRRKFELATFSDGESVEDYVLRLNGMAATLTRLGDLVDEKKVVEKIVRSVPQRFRQIVLSITTLLDVSTLTVSNLVGRLKAAEDAFEEAPGSLQHDGGSTSQRRVGRLAKGEGGGEPLRPQNQRRLGASRRRKTRARAWAWRPLVKWAIIW
jgi:hypothetical protein